MSSASVHPDHRAKILLVDANGLVYRAFFALPYFTTRDGRPTNAVYGFTTMLLKVLEEERPEYVAVAFDKPGPTFRHEASAAYKATRSRMPDDLRPQVALAKEVVEALEMPVFDVAAVRAKLGVAPAQVPDLKSLEGDPTENIPGVPGIGGKTAARLLAQGATVEALLDGPDGVRDARLRERLAAYREQVLQSKHLATISTDVDVPIAWEALRRRPFEAARVRELFTRLEFKSLLDRLGVTAAAPAEQVPGTYRTITADALGPYLAGARQLALATVADAGHPLLARLRGVALAVRPGDAVYLDVSDGLPAALAQALGRDDLPKLSEDSKRDRLLLEGAGAAPRGFAFDVSLASYLLDPGKRTHTLADAAWDHLRWRLSGDAPAEGDGLALGPAPGARAAEAADVILRLGDVMEAELRDRGVDRLYRDVELPLAGVLARMERAGVAIDVEALRALSRTFRARLDALTQEIYRLAGAEFNVGSPKQLAFVLFEKLQLPALKRTKTGFSTDAEVLEQLAPYNEVVARILEHRRLSKLLGTYVDVLPEMVHPQTARLHATFNQAGSSTGRIITTEPNLQNIPIFEEDGRQVRRAFVAGRPGTVLVSADYSQ